MRRGDQRGQTAVLIIGFFLIAALLVVVVVDASAAYLMRQRLDAVADGAALAAADAVKAERVYLSDLDEDAPIDPEAARTAAADYLRSIGAHGDHPGLRMRLRTGPDLVSVQVTAPLDLPFTPPGWVGSATVSGSAAAYVRVTD